MRCVDADGNQIGVIPTSQALQLAHERGMDLIEVAANASPPVCRIADCGKYRFELEKKEKQSRRQSPGSKMKKIKFHANVDEHDFQTKLRHVREFLEEGHRVKMSLMFRGRENAHQEIGYQVLTRAVREVADLGHSERNPEQMGRMLMVMVTPRPTTKQGAAKPAPAPGPAAEPGRPR